jgi:hypothetical protein
MVGFTMDGGSLRLTIAAMDAIGIGVQDVARRATAAAADVLHKEALKNVSLRDHSLTDLRQIDHPYARRHGRINVGALGHTPEWQVHTIPSRRRKSHRNQSGDLARALKYALLPSARPPGEAWVVYFDVDAAPHAVFVVQGTPLMLPRDVLWWTATDPRVQKKMMQAIVRLLGQGLRSKAVVRFGGGGVPPAPGGSLAV